MNRGTWPTRTGFVIAACIEKEVEGGWARGLCVFAVGVRGDSATHWVFAVDTVVHCPDPL